MHGFDTSGLDALVATGTVPGYAVAARVAGRRVVRRGGVADLGTGRAVEDGTVFRLASLSKPVAALVTVQQVEAGVLDLADPVQRWVPELEDLRVLRRPDGPLEDTEPLRRPVTVRDLLTMTSGFGIALAATPLSEAMAEGGIHPGPSGYALDEEAFLGALAPLPLGFQPGEGWAYHTSTDVLGVVLSRACGRGLDALVEEGVRGPLCLDVLDFRAPEPDLLATSYVWDGTQHTDLDPGGFLEVPAFPTLSAGLCATAPAYLAVLDELLAPTTVSAAGASAIRTASLTPTQRRAAGEFLGPSQSYGLHVSVAVEDDPAGPRAGSIGWAGGTGCLAVADPAADRAGVLLTTRLADPVSGPTAFDAFLDLLYGAARDR